MAGYRCGYVWDQWVQFDNVRVVLLLPYRNACLMMYVPRIVVLKGSILTEHLEDIDNFNSYKATETFWLNDNS